MPRIITQADLDATPGPGRAVPQGRTKRLRRLLALWIERQRSRRHLAELPPHMLCDIGMSDEDARREVEKPFWR